MEQFTRSKLLFGQEGLDKLNNSSIVIFGIGGVGSYVVEALARSGVGKLVLVDFDKVCITNINRQIEALLSTIGRPKVEVLRDRIHDINPRCEVTVFQEFVNAENMDKFIESETAYIVDAIDTVSSKLVIIERALELGIPVISSMGMGNKLDPTKIKIGDISDTTECALARVMRRELRKMGITRGIKVVYSIEHARKPIEDNTDIPIGSVSFVPSVAGLFIASEIIRKIIE